MTKKIKYLLMLLLGANLSMTAQFGFSHEVGAFVGGVAFQSDFGVRHDFETNAGNTGFGIGLVHYMNFAYRAECNCYMGRRTTRGTRTRPHHHRCARRGWCGFR